MAKDIKKQKTNTLGTFDIVVPFSNWLPTQDVYHGDLNYRTTRLPHHVFAGLNTTTCNYWTDVIVHFVIVCLYQGFTGVLICMNLGIKKRPRLNATICILLQKTLQPEISPMQSILKTFQSWCIFILTDLNDKKQQIPLHPQHFMNVQDLL